MQGTALQLVKIWRFFTFHQSIITKPRVILQRVTRPSYFKILRNAPICWPTESKITIIWIIRAMPANSKPYLASDLKYVSLKNNYSMWHFTFVLTKYIQKLPQHFKSVADFKSFLSKKRPLSNDLMKERKKLKFGRWPNIH